MKTSRILVRIAVASALAVLSGGAQASGFALIEQNASGLGNAYAGAAAAAEDASTIYFNPAGMTRIPGRQAVGALHLILPSAKFSDTGSTAALGGFALGGNGGDAGGLAAVPNMYLSWQLDPKWFVGVGVTAPFGLATEYDAGWVGRFHALKSEIKTLNINPSVAYKVNDAWSLGFGVNWQKVEAEITKAVNYTAVAAAALIPGVPLGTEGSNKIEGDDDAWGFNLGLMFHPTPNTNLGFSYRSAMRYTLSGSAAFYSRPAPLQAALVVPALANVIGDSPIDANLKLPASYSFALKHQVDPKWDVLFDATRTEWSSIKQLNIVRSNGFLLEGVPFEWKNTWRVGLGANYRYNQEWTFKGGVAYDQTPTSDVYRIPRLPDEDRTWLSFGAQYKVSKAGTLDVGYAHLFVKDPKLNLTGPPALTPQLAAGRGSLVGSYDNNVNILSAQYRHNF
jgi:long-chain fatty acid transport protein